MPGTHLAIEKQDVPGTPPRRKRNRLVEFVLEEARSLLPAWLFFLALFVLLRLTRMEILAEHHIRTFPPSRVLLGSIVVAKGILLVDLIPFIKTMERSSVLEAAALKTLSYYVIVFVFEAVDGIFELRREGFVPASLEFVRQLSTAGFWVIQVWLVLLLFAYSAARELSHKLGPRRFRELLIGK
jgi:hypothetical protein